MLPPIFIYRSIIIVPKRVYIFFVLCLCLNGTIWPMELVKLRNAMIRVQLPGSQKIIEVPHHFCRYTYLSSALRFAKKSKQPLVLQVAGMTEQVAQADILIKAYAMHCISLLAKKVTQKYFFKKFLHASSVCDMLTGELKMPVPINKECQRIFNTHTYHIKEQFKKILPLMIQDDTIAQHWGQFIDTVCASSGPISNQDCKKDYKQQILFTLFSNYWRTLCNNAVAQLYDKKLSDTTMREYATYLSYIFPCYEQPLKLFMNLCHDRGVISRNEAALTLFEKNDNQLTSSELEQKRECEPLANSLLTFKEQYEKYTPYSMHDLYNENRYAFYRIGSYAKQYPDTLAAQLYTIDLSDSGLRVLGSFDKLTLLLEKKEMAIYPFKRTFFKDFSFLGPRVGDYFCEYGSIEGIVFDGNNIKTVDPESLKNNALIHYMSFLLNDVKELIVPCRPHIDIVIGKWAAQSCPILAQQIKKYKKRESRLSIKF